MENKNKFRSSHRHNFKNLETRCGYRSACFEEIYASTAVAKGKEDEDEGTYIVRSSSTMSGSLDQAVELIAASRIEQQQQQQQQQQQNGNGNAAQGEGVEKETSKRDRDNGPAKCMKRGPYKKRKKLTTMTTTHDVNETKRRRDENLEKKKREKRKLASASIDAKLDRMRKKKLVEPKKVMSTYKAFSEHDPKAKLFRRENPQLTNAEKYSKLRELWYGASEEQRAASQAHVKRDELRYQREMQMHAYKKLFVQIASALLKGEFMGTETRKPRKGYFLFESAERAMSNQALHSKDLSIKWKAMTQEERDAFNDDFEIQQQLYNSMHPILEQKMRLIKEEEEDDDGDEEEKDARGEKENQVAKRLHIHIGIETKEAKVGVSERANAELHARFERTRGFEFLRDIKYSLPPLGYMGSDESNQKVKGRKYKDAMEKESGIINLGRMKIVPKMRSEFGYDILKKEIDDLSISPAIKVLSSKCHLDSSSLSKISVLGSKGGVVDFDKLKAFIEKGGNDEKLDLAYAKYVKYNPPDWVSFKEELKL